VYTIEKQTLRAGGFEWRSEIVVDSKREAHTRLRELGAVRLRNGEWMEEGRTAVHFYRIVRTA
jgi:hypothetical protein